MLAHDARRALAGNGAGPALYLVEHSIDATVLGLLDRPQAGRRRTPCAELGTGLFLQDIGKLALPPSLVQHPGPLAPDEWELMMQHTLLGLEFLRDDTISAPPRSRWSARTTSAGTAPATPAALVGEEISLFARIAAVADVFDAVTSERFHAPAVRRRRRGST